MRKDCDMLLPPRAIRHSASSSAAAGWMRRQTQDGQRQHTNAQPTPSDTCHTDDITVSPEHGQIQADPSNGRRYVSFAGRHTFTRGTAVWGQLQGGLLR